jgi:hypothetical protein
MIAHVNNMVKVVFLINSVACTRLETQDFIVQSYEGGEKERKGQYHVEMIDNIY